jgi:hypothetical protein
MLPGRNGKDDYDNDKVMVIYQTYIHVIRGRKYYAVDSYTKIMMQHIILSLEVELDSYYLDL